MGLGLGLFCLGGLSRLFRKKNKLGFVLDIKILFAFHLLRDNVNDLLRQEGAIGEIDLFSLDMDGNDYWIWKQIKCIKPRIVICEYNSIFGSKRQVTVPYKEDFYRKKEHYSEMYFGASLAAFCELAEKKGYDFIGTTRAGVNAYFVRKDLSEPFKKYTSEEGYNESANRDSKSKDGKLMFLRHFERLEVIEDFPIYDIESEQVVKIKDSNI